MRIVFSRKGFDGSAGGCPSPIVDGRPVSLPIPTSGRSDTRFAELGLGGLVEALTRGRTRGVALCHADPDLVRGAFGQTGVAQSHLERSGVREGDLFLFFGLFRRLDPGSRRPRFDPCEKPHHRLFGWLAIGRIARLGADGSRARAEFPKLARHPHLGPGWDANNTLYLASPLFRPHPAGRSFPGFGVARRASAGLRLTAPGAPPSLWSVPNWLSPLAGGVGMSYHGASGRWLPGRCRVVSRGQEFVADIGERADARAWLAAILAEMVDG
jgi:hypothetical protein